MATARIRRPRGSLGRVGGAAGGDRLECWPGEGHELADQRLALPPQPIDRRVDFLERTGGFALAPLGIGGRRAAWPSSWDGLGYGNPGAAGARMVQHREHVGVGLAGRLTCRSGIWFRAFHERRSVHGCKPCAHELGDEDRCDNTRSPAQIRSRPGCGG